MVGIPSLRLKGDYLAIVTLGFGEIIRVVILNIPAVGGATGFTAALPITITATIRKQLFFMGPLLGVDRRERRGRTN